MDSLERAVVERQAAAERGDSEAFTLWRAREQFYRLGEAFWQERKHPRNRLGMFKPGDIIGWPHPGQGMYGTKYGTVTHTPDANGKVRVKAAGKIIHIDPAKVTSHVSERMTHGGLPPGLLDR